MKLIGKQIVVELPEKKSGVMAILDKNGTRYYEQIKLADGAWNDALSEVAKMNPAWEVDEEAMNEIICDEWYNQLGKNMKRGEAVKAFAHALASNPSAWMKRKEQRNG